MKNYSSIRIIFIAFLCVLSLPPAGHSASKFREKFIENFTNNRFTQQVDLVKKNKDIMPEEIKSILAEAVAEENYEKRMYLLGIANAMAAMYRSWHGDEQPYVEVEAVQKIEAEREQRRKDEIEKWKKYEKFIGNIVMKDKMQQMESASLKPVTFPHWLHRIWFRCKVCHQDIFIKERGANEISHDRFASGKQCAFCHNGDMAFGTKDKCENCHNVGIPEGERLFDLSKADHKKIKDVAAKVGAEWNYEKLPDGKIPVDKFKFIDWIQLDNMNIIKPVVSLDKAYKDEIRDNKILFEPKSDFVNSVIFDHKVHSEWHKCEVCHPHIFEPKLGGNVVMMKDMQLGKACGNCHGKVSFTFASCTRCHTHPKGSPVPDGVMQRHVAHEEK